MDSDESPDDELVQRRLEESEEKLMRWKRKARALRENRNPQAEEAQENWEKVVKDGASTELKLRLWKAKAAASRKGDVWNAEQSIQEIYDEQQDMLREGSIDELEPLGWEETTSYQEGRRDLRAVDEEVELERIGSRSDDTERRRKEEEGETLEVERRAPKGEGDALCLAARSGKIEAVRKDHSDLPSSDLRYRSPSSWRWVPR
eukprot:757591-Hanusia_phi.AAC.3